jgi:hypothetical protein
MTPNEGQIKREELVLLAKAFRGELVPQDPNDEPTSVLLKRIRAAREAAPAKPRPRKGDNQPKAREAEVTMPNRKDMQDALSRRRRKLPAAKVRRLERFSHQFTLQGYSVRPERSGAKSKADFQPVLRLRR